MKKHYQFKQLLTTNFRPLTPKKISFNIPQHFLGPLLPCLHPSAYSWQTMWPTILDINMNYQGVTRKWMWPTIISLMFMIVGQRQLMGPTTYIRAFRKERKFNEFPPEDFLAMGKKSKWAHVHSDYRISWMDGWMDEVLTIDLGLDILVLPLRSD